MSKSKSGREGVSGAPSASRWKGRDSLDMVYRLNERSLELLATVARSSVPCELAGISQHRELWAGLGAEAIKHAARPPFVILDAHFTNKTWWRQVIQPCDAADSRVVSPGHWPTNLAEPLMQETLIFAWHSVKWDRRVAHLSLGMSPAVSDIIAGLSPQQLSDISHGQSGELRLRWQDNADFWSQLLRTVRSGDRSRLDEIHLHAKLLLCGELISNSM
jgi:hypothetical protein